MHSYTKNKKCSGEVNWVLLALIFGMDHQELKVYIFYINDDHGLPLP